MTPSINPNPYAAVGYAGLNDASPEGYIDRPFTYIFDVTLTALQALTNQAVSIQTDADFFMRAWLVNSATSLQFTLRLSDSTGYFLSNSQLQAAALSNFFGQPMPMLPEWWFPAGGRIGIDITDFSNAGNVIELAFIGVKRFKS